MDMLTCSLAYIFIIGYKYNPSKLIVMEISSYDDF